MADNVTGYPPQQHALGCGIACVSYAANVSYRKSLSTFDNPEENVRRGCYCREMVAALARLGHDYSFIHNRRYSIGYAELPVGSIAYIPKCTNYPAGHFIYRDEVSWVDPWHNCRHSADISAAQSGRRYRMDGHPQYMIVPGGDEDRLRRLIRRRVCRLEQQS